MFRNLAYLLSLMLTLALAVPSARAATISGCELAALNRIAADGPMSEAMLASPQMFYSDGGSHPTAYPFFASNEFDWYNTEWDLAPTDVLVGFGTNTAWDLASRKRAKLLMVADWQLGPLIAQNYILRPMLRVAKTPGEFMAMVLGLPLPPAGTDIIGFENYFRDIVPRLTPEMMYPTFANTLERLRAGGLSEAEYQALRMHFQEIMRPGMSGPDAFGVLRGHNAHQNGHLGQFFGARYMPHALIGQGAPSEVVTHPEFSFLASQSTFDRFKAQYATAQYAHTDYQNPEFYRKLKAEGDKKGYTKYTFSLTNILDVARMDKDLAIEDLEAYRRMIYQIFPANKYEVIIFLTTNYRPPHGFIRLERNTAPPLERWHFTPRFSRNAG